MPKTVVEKLVACLDEEIYKDHKMEIEAKKALDRQIAGFAEKENRLNLNLPKPKLKKASVYQERSEATEVKPEYYYETIERMFPGCNFLDVFSAEPCNSKWKTLFNKDEKEKDNEEN